MANKKQEQSRKEKEQAEIERQKQVQADYDGYVSRINARIEKGENEIRQAEGSKLLEVLPFEKWTRKATRKIDGVDVDFVVSGDSGETKNEKFRRLGRARMSKVLENMDLILNLSSPQYEATPQDIEKMVNALKLKVNDIEKAFSVQKKKEESFDF